MCLLQRDVRPLFAGKILRPVQTLGPHVAALGLAVYTGAMFPRDYNRSFLVAEHGSWRLKRKGDIGHRVSRRPASPSPPPPLPPPTCCGCGCAPLASRMACFVWAACCAPNACWLVDLFIAGSSRGATYCMSIWDSGYKTLHVDGAIAEVAVSNVSAQVILLRTAQIGRQALTLDSHRSKQWQCAQVVQVKVDAGGRATSHRVFASGWATKSGSPEQDFWGEDVLPSLPAACTCVHTGMSPTAPRTHWEACGIERLGLHNELIRSMQVDAAGAQVDQWTCCRCQTALCLYQTTTPAPSRALLTAGADDDTQGTAWLPTHICCAPGSDVCLKLETLATATRLVAG